MKRWPLKFQIYADGATADGIDYGSIDGAVLVPAGVWRVPVFAHEVTRSMREWSQDLNAFLLRESLLIHCPPGCFSPGQLVGTSAALGWEIDGGAEDSNSNPYWSPGLVTYMAKRTGLVT